MPIKGGIPWSSGHTSFNNIVNTYLHKPDKDEPDVRKGSSINMRIISKSHPGHLQEHHEEKNRIPQ